MKSVLTDLLQQAISKLMASGELPPMEAVHVVVDTTRDPSHGDFASNLALTLSRQAGCPPRQLAEKIVGALPAHEAIEKVDIAGPGFINFHLAKAAAGAVVGRILQEKEHFGRRPAGQGERIHIEYVSANPTGPLHVGHGRGAAYGATVADLLEAAGHEVHREYYVNDAGRQMHILATSVWLRYLEQCGEPLTFPSNGYRGEYILDIADKLRAQVDTRLRHPADVVFADITPDEPAGGDKEAHIDDLIVRARQFLGEDYDRVFNLALDEILGDIREDLAEFGVTYQTWFSEKSLVSSGAISRALDKLRDAGHLYEKEGAWWFRSTTFGDDKDRVVIRDNGQTTYFASDIAYHMNKLERGFGKIIDVLGADHHGYVPRVKAAMAALGADPEQLQAPLVQFAILYRGGKKVQMSTRSGSFVTLRQLREEVGNDAARFFYVMRKADQHMDFDLDLAKSQSNDNPMYYIQYAHARICSVFRQLKEAGQSTEVQQGLQHLDRLDRDDEAELMKMLSRYPEVVQKAAESLSPHLLAHYLRELAQGFHGYYNSARIAVEEEALRSARLSLAAATRQVLANGLHLLGVSAPESM
jgi:arginyl-tRNA synthetase